MFYALDFLNTPQTRSFGLISEVKKQGERALAANAISSPAVDEEFRPVDPEGFVSSSTSYITSLEAYPLIQCPRMTVEKRNIFVYFHSIVDFPALR